MIKFLNVEDIAKACHAAIVEGYWGSFDEFEPVPWDNLTDADKQIGKDTAAFIIKKPTAGVEELSEFYLGKIDDNSTFGVRTERAIRIVLFLVKSLAHLVDPVELDQYPLK